MASVPFQSPNLDMAAALDPLQISLVSRITRINEYTKTAKLKDSPPANTSVDEAHTSLVKAGEALAQQTRAFHLLMGTSPPPEQLQACARDLVSAVEMYDSWVGTLLTVALPAVRKAVGGQLCLVLESLHNVVRKVIQHGEATASDVGRVQAAVDALPALQTSARDTATKLLGEAKLLAADALREVREAIAEGKASGAAKGEEDDEEEGDEEEEEEEEPEFFAIAAVATPAEQLVAAAVETLHVAHDDGLRSGGGDDTTLTMLITCAQAASTCIDSTVACAYDGDVPGVAKNAASLGKVMGKLIGVLGRRCGLQDDARCSRLSATLDASLAELTSACAALEEQEKQQAAVKGVAALSIS